MIKLTKVDFAYEGRPPVFQALDFSLNQGERLGILGPNGAGKSTLFMLAMGLLMPDKGAVELFGQECAGEKDFRLLRTRIGYCFQDPDDQLFSATEDSIRRLNSSNPMEFMNSRSRIPGLAPAR